jgi:hypothetical protein
MWTRLRERANFANVVALCALFIALGSGAYAALKLEANSVRSKHIVNGQVKASDVADPRFKPLTLVNGWVDAGTPYPTPGYAVDSAGVVHLRGVVDGSVSESPQAFFLPKVARPARRLFEITKGGGNIPAYASVDVDGQVRLNGDELSGVSLENISFAAK